MRSKADQQLQEFLDKRDVVVSREKYDNGNVRYKVQKKVGAYNHIQIFSPKGEEKYKVEVTSGLIGQDGSSWYFDGKYDLRGVENILTQYEL